MDSFILSIISVLIVSSISLIGVLILLKKISPESKVINILISFAAGALIGDAFIHLLPEYIELYGYTSELSLYIFIGIIIMLIVEAYFHSQHNHNAELVDDRRPLIARLNILSDAFHNLLDGFAIGVSFIISPEIGIATTIAVILHEIPQELADTAILVYSGWRRRKILLINFITALTALVGVLIVFISENLIEDIEKILLPVAIGQFLYISLASLVPEIHRRSNLKKYIGAILAFTLGIVVMYLLILAE